MTNLTKFTPDRDRIPIIEYDKSKADEILEGMMNGELLAVLCKPKTMPLPSTVRRWALSHEEFGTRFHKAVEIQAHMLFEEGVQVLRDAGPKDNQTRNKNHADACFKAAGKYLPKVYGDKADVATIIPIHIQTNLGDGKEVVGVGHGVYRVEQGGDDV